MREAAASAVALGLWLCSFCVLVFNVRADVATCGGFVQISPKLAKLMTDKLDFSSVQVELYNTEGLLKYTADCAPNGYYLIPIYEKGSYKLQVHAQNGWTFEPDHVAVSINDKENGCGEDINFAFTGFSLSGVVLGASSDSCGSASVGRGPSGVAMSLLDAKGQQAQTAQSTNGIFSFNNVLPGKYSVVAGHSTFSVTPAKQEVTMKLGNTELPEPFQVKGYRLSGKVTASGSGISGINVFLYANGVKHLDCAAIGADTAKPDGKGTPLCVSRTDASGDFSFADLPCAQYTLVPFYQQGDTAFEVSPSELQVSLHHENRHLDAAFKVLGFSVSGKVVDRNGKGMEGVAVTAGDGHSTTTDSTGTYRLARLTAGSYTIKATKEHYVFHDLRNTPVSHTATTLPDIAVVKMHVCGRIDSGETGVEREVTLSNSDVKLSTTSSKRGEYCFEVGPGTYVVRPRATSKETAAGIRLSPAERSVTVKEAPILDLHFSQARLSLSGSVTCLRKPCPRTLRVTLASSHSDEISATLDSDDKFTFNNVAPGVYRVAAKQDGFCWATDSVEVSVGDSDVKDVVLTQSGYQIQVQTSHEVPASVRHSASGDSQQTRLRKGHNELCLPAAGKYELTTDSCYKFEKAAYTIDTTDPHLVELVAKEFKVPGYLVLTASGGVSAPEKVSVDVRTSGEAAVASSTIVQATQVTDSATATKILSEVNADKTDKHTVYSYTFWAVPHVKYDVAAVPGNGPSSPYLFYPRHTSVSVGRDACPNAAPTLKGRRGVFYNGTVTPATAGVEIIVESNAAGAAPVVAKTDASGRYTVGPLYDDEEYTVSAKSEGYHFKRDESGNFRAMKLGHVTVHVRDEQGASVAGVLLSLSGEGYRHNNVTNNDGKYVFADLFPGQYFVVLNLKEYKFEPKSKSITVEESNPQVEIFVAKRIGYSVYGRVTALNGEPEADVVVEALLSEGGAHGARKVVEDTKTDANGEYRLRGLEPGKNYHIAVKAGVHNPSSRIERASPADVAVVVKNEDIRGAHFTAFRKSNKFDVTGMVEAKEQFLDNLRIELCRESAPTTPIKTTTVSKAFPYFEFSSVPADKYIVRTRSSLSTRTHTYENPEAVVSVQGHSHVVLNFTAQVKSVSHDTARASVGPLVLAALLAAAAYFREQLLALVNRVRGRQGNGNDASLSASASDDSMASKGTKRRRL